MNQNEFVSTIASVRPQATFLTLHKYRAESGEVADHQVVFHVSYEELLNRSVALLNAMTFESQGEKDAQRVLLASFMESLSGIKKTKVDEIEDAYERFFDESGAHIKGIKRHLETGAMHLYGATVQKRIHVEGIRKAVNSKPETILKNRIRAMLPVSKWRQYRLLPDQVELVTVDKLRILPPIPGFELR
jgi:hypothetical protein